MCYNYNKQNVILCCCEEVYHVSSGGLYRFYGTSGVCRVDEVKPSPFEDEADRQYYTLTPVTGTETIYIPVDSPVFMRPVISREQAETLVRDIPNIEVDHFTSHSMRLSSEHYQEVLQSHDCGDLVQLIKTVYAKEQAQRPPAESGRSALPQARGGAAARRAVGGAGDSVSRGSGVHRECDRQAGEEDEEGGACRGGFFRRGKRISAAVWRRRRPVSTGGDKGQGHRMVFLAPLDTPESSFCADTSEMCSETGRRGARFRASG